MRRMRQLSLNVCLCLGLAFFSDSTLAQTEVATPNRVVLLTSFASKNKEVRLERRLEKIFKESLTPNYEIVVIHNSDQEVLFRELHNSANKALFWVSHAAFNRSYAKKSYSKLGATPTLAPEQTILDYRKDNVAPLFNHLTTPVDFLAVIGCNTDKILKDLELSHYVAHGKVKGPLELKKAVHRFLKLESHSPSNTLNANSSKEAADELVSVRITRSIPTGANVHHLRSLRVVVNGNILGVISVVAPGKNEEFFIQVPRSLLHFPIEIQSAQSVGTSDQKIIFGEITVQVANNEYRLFTRSDGIPFGKNRRVFLP